MTDHEVGRLLSLISHEVRGPLGVMRGYLKMLDQAGAALPEPQRRAVAAALQAGDRATDLLTHVSTLAAMHRGETALIRREIAVDRLLQEIVQAVPSSSSPVVTLEAAPAPDLTLSGDRALLTRALTGLAATLVRAQSRDGALLVTAEEHVREGVRGVRVTIGAPLAAVEGSDTPLDLTRGGIGLELPIAAWIVAAHGGDIREHRDGTRLRSMVVWVPVVERSAS